MGGWVGGLVAREAHGVECLLDDDGGHGLEHELHVLAVGCTREVVVDALARVAVAADELVQEVLQPVVVRVDCAAVVGPLRDVRDPHTRDLLLEQVGLHSTSTSISNNVSNNTYTYTQVLIISFAVYHHHHHHHHTASSVNQTDSSY